MNSLVSILIPSYNAEKYIADTIQCALNQSWTNKEIIVIDDGSTDKSFEIAKKFESAIVKVFSQINSGSCVTRNRLFELSSGDYIQYLDADDLLSPSKIEVQIELLKQSDNSISSCPWGVFYKTKEDVEIKTELVWKDYINPVDWLTDAWLGGGMMQTACWLTPRKLIQNSGGWNESLLKNPNDDGEFFCRVLLQSESIFFAEKATVYYRKPAASNVSRQISSIAVNSQLESYKQYEVHILKKVDSEKIRNAIANNYVYFIYKYDRAFPDLCKLAENYVYQLGFRKLWPIGSGYFRKIANIVGFKKALFVRKIFRKNPIL